MLQEHRSPQRSGSHLRRWWPLLIIIASLIYIYIMYVFPFLASTAGGSDSTGKWSLTRQRQIAFELAQNVQNYRKRINEGRRVNYGDAYIEVTGITTPFRPPNPFDGMDSPSGARNDTHSEAKLKGWALATIRRNLQAIASGSVINVLVFTQVKTCPDCRRDTPTWVKQLQQVAPAGVTVYLSIWQQIDFDIDHPDQTPVISADGVEPAVSGSAP